MHPSDLRFPLLAILLLPGACDRGVLHTGAAGATVAPPIPVPVRGTAVTTCDAGFDCSGQGTDPGGTCDPGLVACPGPGAGYCFDLRASPEHCGVCGHACALGSPCDNGQCRVVHCTSQVSARDLPVGRGTDLFNQAALLDCDGDGALDMIAPPPISLYQGVNRPEDVQESVSVYHGNSDGTFTLGERYPAQVGQASSGFFRVLAADLNRDQIPDIIMNGPVTWTPDETQISFVVRLGNGDCTFGPEIGLVAGLRPSSIALADLDGDGVLDLAVTVETGTHLRTFHGNGDGSFSNRQDLTVDGLPSTVAVTDWNADGIPDLVAADSYLHLLLGTGHGQFAPAIDCAVDLTASWGNNRWVAPVIADFDQDGIVDMAVNNTVLFGMHECNFTKVFTLPAPYNTALPLLAGDLNGDGALDLVFDSGHGIGLLPGDGQGDFGTIVMLGGYDRTGRDAWPTFAFAGDFNGDGRIDLAVTGENSIRTFINTCQ